MASLNIKNEETYRMVRTLADLKGVSLVAAVNEAVREKLDRERAEKERLHSRAHVAERLMEIARETAAMMDDGRTSTQLLDALYDPVTGLPK